ncbi:hypothetical protein Lesp02_33510 [Lentzea sp. NBRC 105346]|nr:hypothetical protein Lesp02_33510 [Lentzea sp. NBRC 105346]
MADPFDEVVQLRELPRLGELVGGKHSEWLRAVFCLAALGQPGLGGVLGHGLADLAGGDL